MALPVLQTRADTRHLPVIEPYLDRQMRVCRRSSFGHGNDIVIRNLFRVIEKTAPEMIDPVGRDVAENPAATFEFMSELTRRSLAKPPFFKFSKCRDLPEISCRNGSVGRCRPAVRGTRSKFRFLRGTAFEVSLVSHQSPSAHR